MFLKTGITIYTGEYSAEIKKLKKEIEKADAVIIGAGAGLSVSAGLTYSGERFLKYFADFNEKYGIEDMYWGGFYPFETPEEYWAWWSRQIWCNRYLPKAEKVYLDLLQLIKEKDYFVLTTNVDHQFQKAGFEKERLFYTQGDYGLFQCKNTCVCKTFDNEEVVKEMVERQKDMKIPKELIPLCPVCKEEMTMNLRCDDDFVEDDGWHLAAGRYKNFLQKCKNKRILFLELGVGMNTPAIIKYPFWKMTYENKNAVFASINDGDTFCPSEIKDRSILINSDIKPALNSLLEK